jgi:hypothetical protein
MSLRRAAACAVAVAAVAGSAVASGGPPPAASQRAATTIDWTAELLTRADQVAQEVARVRGLPLLRPIQRDVVEVDELRRRLLARARRERTANELAAEEIAAKRWGLVPPGVRYADLLVDVLTEQIAGYYDPEDARLYIARRDGAGDAFADMLLAHEIDHALQDQHFDLERWMDLPVAEGDALLARQALVEGDGVVLMVELMLARQKLPAPWGSPAVAQTMERAMASSAGNDQLARAPLAVRESLMFPYRAGLAFVAELRRRHSWRRVDAAFQAPPRSTEQILHPELYLAGEEPVAVTAAALPALSGYRTAHETVWGEHGVGVLLREHGVSVGDATAAAAGWGGDRVVVLVPPPGRGRASAPDWRRAVGLALTVWDSEIDALEAAAALTAAVDDLIVGAAVERGAGITRWVGVDGREARVERRGDTVLVAIGVPLGAGAAVATQVFTGWTVVAPAGPPAPPAPVTPATPAGPRRT